MRPNDRKGQGNGEKSSSSWKLKDPQLILAQDPVRSLIGGIFRESSDQLYMVFKRLDQASGFCAYLLGRGKVG